MLNCRPPPAPGLYVITNQRSGKIYVGSSSDIRRRWRQHCRRLERGSHHCSHLLHAWKKYGAEAFEFTVLAFCDDEATRLRLEDALLSTSPKNRLYNTFRGAVGSIHTPATRARISASLKGRGAGQPKSAEHREAIGAAQRGKRLTEETKRKMSIAARGRTLTPEHVAKIAASNRARNAARRAARA